MNNFQPHSTTFTHFFLDLDDFCLLFKTLFTHFLHFLRLFLWNTFLGHFLWDPFYIFYIFFLHFLDTFWDHFRHILKLFGNVNCQMSNIRCQMSKYQTVKMSKCQNVKMSICQHVNCQLSNALEISTKSTVLQC